jgi:mono/diheme cytochrome c family protein
MNTFIRTVALVLSLTAPIWLAGCSKKSTASAGPGFSPESAKEAKEIFSTRCMPCHGASGQGDGPASAGLAPKPRNFHDGAWQSGASNQHIEMIIQFGGVAVGKSPAMPPNPDLVAKPFVVAALRAHIRELGK